MTLHELPQSIALPRGLVTVDLVNERGRVVQREQAENFISLQSQAAARWWQRMMWGMFNPNEAVDALGIRPTEMPWTPTQHIAAWSDATAEDPATEVGIRGEITAWASRHPVGSPTGKRGNVDIALSEFKDAYAKWVFNWTGAQGNGTFQSVGWTRMNESNNLPIPGGFSDEMLTINNTSNAHSSGNFGHSLWWDAANSLWNTWEYVSATLQYRIVSVPAGGGATTQICLLPASAWNSPYAYGLARIGSDIIVCGGNGGNTMYLRRYAVTGTQLWTVNHSFTSAQYYYDCTIDGSGNIWTICGDGKIRKHSPTDGSITSTATLTGIPATYAGYPCGIAYDPIDGNFWVSMATAVAVNARVMYKVTSAGVPASTAVPVSFMESYYATTATSPYAGTYYTPGTFTREPYVFNPWSVNQPGGSDISRSPNLPLYPGTLAMKDGILWGSNRKPVQNVGAYLIAPWAPNGVVAGTLGSRSLLPNPVVKDSSQTMKITYQFDFS